MTEGIIPKDPFNARAGTDARTIQQRMGHMDLETTMGYLSAAEGEEATKQANALESYAGI
jgi:integrase